ncbi:MAG: hypothetical protein JWO58_3198 [Chitinophagaceae bacterium]|nr:hypothetical protein [Chitinophagaceae bacterium]
MKSKYLVHFVCALTLIGTLSSCQKVIDVDLNSASPQIVIVGEVTDQSGPYVVTLSQTVNFSDANVFPTVSGAQVIIRDNAGNSETLTETSPGTYKTSTLQGTVGRAYSISVASQGNNYDATSVMPAAVAIDSLYIDSTSSSGFGNSKKKNKSVRVLFTDPASIENYYRFVEVVNGVAKPDFFITSDRFKDGSQINYKLSVSDSTLNSGDLVTVTLQSIDKNTYEYFRTLNQVASGGSFQSTPGNPTTNLSNNALGYFSACGIRSKSIVVP